MGSLVEEHLKAKAEEGFSQTVLTIKDFKGCSHTSNTKASQKQTTMGPQTSRPRFVKDASKIEEFLLV